MKPLKNKKNKIQELQKLQELTVKNFLNELSSKSPAPGGGSVVALAGALSASLVSMVARLTIGKKKYSSVETQMKKVLAASERLRGEFLELVQKDSDAFLEVIECKSSVASLKRAIEVPGRTAKFAGDILKLALIVREKGNKNAVTDAKIAIDLARIAKKGAILNVKVNEKQTQQKI